MSGESMAERIKDRILECCTLFAFDYKRKEYNIDPFSETDFHIYADGNEFNVSDIEDVMGMPYIDGKSLNEVADLIENIDW